MSVYDTPTFLSRTLLTCVLRDPNRAALTFATIPEDRFPIPERYVAKAMTKLRIARTPLTMTAVIDQMARDETLSMFGGEVEVRTLEPGYVYGSTPDEYDYALDHVAQALGMEQLHRSTAKAAALLEERGDIDVADMANLLIREAEEVKARASNTGDHHVRSLRELLAYEEEESFDWVIPGLLEHGDRLIITGSEGLGKSTLLRQIAVCTAAGVHPFRHHRIPQKRVLYVDCEVFDRQNRRVFRTLTVAARQLGEDPVDWLDHEARTGGMELDKVTDETELVRMVEASMPDLLVIGPVYRLYARDGNEEETGRAVTRVLDRVREISRAAIVTEAHIPHAVGGHRSLRPLGTSLWMRWPEFGYGITMNPDSEPDEHRVLFQSWRGDREVREWPSALKGGGVLPFGIDWTPGVSVQGETLDDDRKDPWYKD